MSNVIEKTIDYVTLTAVNYRTARQVNHFTKAGVFKEGVVIQVLEGSIRNGWATIKYNDNYYFIMAKYIAPKEKDTTALNVGDKVEIISKYAASCVAQGATRSAEIGTTCYIAEIVPGENFPYHLSTRRNSREKKYTIGFARADAIKKV